MLQGGSLKGAMEAVRYSTVRVPGAVVVVLVLVVVVCGGVVWKRMRRGTPPVPQARRVVGERGVKRVDVESTRGGGREREEEEEEALEVEEVEVEEEVEEEARAASRKEGGAWVALVSILKYPLGPGEVSMVYAARALSASTLGVCCWRR